MENYGGIMGNYGGIMGNYWGLWWNYGELWWNYGGIFAVWRPHTPEPLAGGPRGGGGGLERGFDLI